MMRTVVLLGMGTIARRHLAVLEEADDVEVVAAVDVDPREVAFRGRPVAVHASLASAIEDHPDPDVVVITTPSRLHADHVGLAARLAPTAELWVEKPVAVTTDELARVREVADTHAPGVRALYHARHAPEVEWAVAHLADLVATHGPPVAVEAFFSDPYAGEDAAARRATLLDPWLDSGINAISVLDPLVRIEQLGPAEPRGEAGLTTVAPVAFEGGADHLLVAGEPTSEVEPRDLR